MSQPARSPNGMPDFHQLLGGAGGSFTSDETGLAAMNVKSADPNSKSEERRNTVLDLAGDEGAVRDLSLDTSDPLKKPRG